MTEERTISRADAVAIANLCSLHGCADMTAGLLLNASLDEARDAIAARKAQTGPAIAEGRLHECPAITQ